MSEFLHVRYDCEKENMIGKPSRRRALINDCLEAAGWAYKECNDSLEGGPNTMCHCANDSQCPTIQRPVCRDGACVKSDE
jgi:hypothetical protein